MKTKRFVKLRMNPEPKKDGRKKRVPYFNERACVVNTRELQRGDTSHGA